MDCNNIFTPIEIDAIGEILNISLGASATAISTMLNTRVDITMPNMDGLEALKAIKSYDSEAKVVMCSAMGQESMVIDAIKSGAKDFIVKPFKPDRIIKTVSSILG